MNEATDQAPVVIITGMHRSGTSLAAAVLRQAGASLGRRLMVPSPGNTRGYFENLDFVELHQAILESQGLSPEGWTLAPEIRVADAFREQARAVVERNAEHPLWGWKDPRTTLFLGFWAELLPQARFVFIYRHPWEVVDSLFRRGNPGDEVFANQPYLALQLWLEYNRRILSFLDRRPGRGVALNLCVLPAPSRQLIESVNSRFDLRLPFPDRELFEPSLLNAEVTQGHRPRVLAQFYPEAAQMLERLDGHARALGVATPFRPVEETVGNGSPAWMFQDWMALRSAQRRQRELERELGAAASDFRARELTLGAEISRKEQSFAEEIAQKDRALSAEVGRREQMVAELRAQLQAQAATIEQKERAAQLWRTETQALTAQLAQKEQASEELHARLVRLGSQAEAIEEELDRHRRSWSWRLTAPFRFPGGLWAYLCRKARGGGRWLSSRVSGFHEWLVLEAYQPIPLTNWTPTEVVSAFPRQEEGFRWIPRLEMQQRARNALFLHPPGRVNFQFQVPARAILRFFYCLQPEVWDRNRGGVEFRVEASAAGCAGALRWQGIANPGQIYEHRRWLEGQLDLRRFAGQTVSLTFATVLAPGAAPEYAWAVWGSPQLLVRRAVSEAAASVRERVRQRGVGGVLKLAQQLAPEPPAVPVVERARPAAKARKPSRPSAAQQVRPAHRRFMVYSSSEGNYFFHEIRDLVAAGLAELGFEVGVGHETDGFRQEADWHLVVAPHEFFHLGKGKAWHPHELPPNLVLVNTEQPSTHWFSLARDCFSQAHAVWDISYQSALLVRSHGFPCDYLPLGHVEGFPLLAEVTELPENYGTCFLPAEARRRSWLRSPVAERPLDILFVGQLTPRRGEFFARATPVLADYRCYLQFSDGSAPVVPGLTTYMDTATVAGLAQRSKILLNLHRGEDTYFEWHRIVLHGIWQRALVISEPCTAAPPFEPGIDFVQCPSEQIPEAIRYYLSSADGQREAQAIVDHASRTLRERCRLAERLRPMILQFYIPPTQTRFWSGDASGDGAGLSTSGVPPVITSGSA